MLITTRGLRRRAGSARKAALQLRRATTALWLLPALAVLGCPAVLLAQAEAPATEAPAAQAAADETPAPEAAVEEAPAPEASAGEAPASEDEPGEDDEARPAE